MDPKKENEKKNNTSNQNTVKKLDAQKEIKIDNIDDFEDIVLPQNKKSKKFDEDDELSTFPSTNVATVNNEEEYEVVDEDEEEYEVVDEDEEEYEVVDEDEDDFEVVDEDEEEYEVVDEDEEEYEVVDEDEEEFEVIDEDEEEYEVVDEDEDDFEVVDEDEEDFEVIDEDEDEFEVVDEEIEIIENDTENRKDEELTETNEDNVEKIIEESTNDEDDESNSELIEEYYEDEDEDDDDEKVEESLYPEELVNIELECVYLGMLFNNPKAISRFHFTYDDCKFSDEELMNLYRIIIYRDGEAYAPAVAKNRFQLPIETPNTYELRLKVKKIAESSEENLENVYRELKKLFIIKKSYMVAPTSAVQEKILEIQNYKLYSDMTVEEVENALEQITVTTGLTQGRLNNDTTSFLLAGDNALTNGISLPFKILSTVFKGLRKGETMCYAMPSNSGKSRFTINMAAYISFVHKEKVLIISNEMSEEKMKLCMITTILNNPEIQVFHGQKISKTEGELLELKFRPDKGKRVKCDENGFILRKEKETQEEFIERLKKNSTEFKQTIAVTDWVNTQVNNSIFFIHITEHTNDDLRKIIMNYYYKEGIQYMFYDTLKADTANIGSSDEVKKTATILSNLAQKFKIFIASSMQLLESTTLPVNLTINDMSASKTAKEVLDTLCLLKQISKNTLYKYEYSETELFEKCYDIEIPKDPDVRYYACVVDKNRAGAKPTVLFKLNLAYNSWEELGHVRLKQTEVEE